MNEVTAIMINWKRIYRTVLVVPQGLLETESQPQDEWSEVPGHLHTQLEHKHNKKIIPLLQRPFGCGGFAFLRSVHTPCIRVIAQVEDPKDRGLLYRA